MEQFWIVNDVTLSCTPPFCLNKLFLFLFFLYDSPLDASLENRLVIRHSARDLTLDSWFHTRLVIRHSTRDSTLDSWLDTRLVIRHLTSPSSLLDSSIVYRLVTRLGKFHWTLVTRVVLHHWTRHLNRDDLFSLLELLLVTYHSSFVSRCRLLSLDSSFVSRY